MKDYIAIDLETTGFKYTSKIIEIGAIRVIGGVAKDKFETKINPADILTPNMTIPRDITEITGITNDDVKNAPILEDVLPDLYNFMGDLPLLAHNIQFDYNILKYNANLLGYDFTIGGTRKGICTLMLSRKLYPNMEHHRLIDMVTKLVPRFSNGKFHSAYYDAYMCKLIYDVMLDKYGEILGVKEPTILE